MLHIVIPEGEFFNEKTNEFITTSRVDITLEHSLVSISKWESKWHKPFLGDGEKTDEETIDYIKCMTVSQNIKPEVYKHLTKQNLEDIHNYINDPMTATTINEQKQNSRHKKEIITSEVIYYWMIALNIPFECQRWHINRLLTLIRVCDIKSQPQKKMGRNEILQRNRELNAARKKRLNTRG